MDKDWENKNTVGTLYVIEDLRLDGASMCGLQFVGNGGRVDRNDARRFTFAEAEAYIARHPEEKLKMIIDPNNENAGAEQVKGSVTTPSATGDPEVLKLKRLQMAALDAMESALEITDVAKMDSAIRVSEYARKQLNRIYHGHYDG